MKEVSKEAYDEAQKITRQYYAQRKKIEDEKHRKELKLLVGNCYKFKNSYGSGDSWWLYKKVVSMKDDILIVESIQKDNSERIQVERRKEFLPRILSGDITISEKEYIEKTSVILKELDSTQHSFSNGMGVEN